MKKPNRDTFTARNEYKLGFIGSILFQLEVWENENTVTWVLVMYGDKSGVRDHALLDDRTAGMILRETAQNE